MSEITGKDILALGISPGPHIRLMLDRCKAAGHVSMDLIEDLVPPPTIPLRDKPLPYSVFLEPENEEEEANKKAVLRHFDELMRTPTIRKGAVMPDACPSGSALGTIPVGGVVACENAIHPGFHSADVCCSMALSTVRGEIDVDRLLDAAYRKSHFGPRRYPREGHIHTDELKALIEEMERNEFLKDLTFFATRDFMTQGDGNHFFYVGEMPSGIKVIVTHHGSRGLGARLYKKGKAVAERMTKAIAPAVLKHNAWMPADSEEGKAYWKALQIVRRWTKLNHFAIHDAVLEDVGVSSGVRIWNEHNFVFRRDDGLYYHGKGATPNYDGFSEDDMGQTLVPMNMGREILVLKHADRQDALGFAPHGAGRNISRSAHMRVLEAKHGPLTASTMARIIEDEVGHVDARFYAIQPDLSELPSAYKSADQVIASINKHGLGEVDTVITPLGSMMAGEFPQHWRKK